MTTVAIVPIPSQQGEMFYRAVSGRRKSDGKTAGEALDSLTAQFDQNEIGTLIVVQHHRPDRFFTAGQQNRMEELMRRWRAARDGGSSLPTDEAAELDALIEAEVRAATDRAAALVGELGS